MASGFQGQLAIRVSGRILSCFVPLIKSSAPSRGLGLQSASQFPSHCPLWWTSGTLSGA
jgi:hypothetical protein